MAAVTDNALFLYRCITESKMRMDWVVLGDALGLKPGTGSMRWQRLKARMEKSGPTAGNASTDVDDNTLFLYQCITHSSYKINFNAVGKALGLKNGTAYMRYHRLKDRIKQQLGDPLTPQRPPVAKASISRTPQKRKAKTAETDSEEDASSTEDPPTQALKTEELDTPTKRQTRGKVLDYKHMLDDAASGGPSTASTNASSYEATASSTSIGDFWEEDNSDDIPNSLVQARSAPKKIPGTTPKKAPGGRHSGKTPNLGLHSEAIEAGLPDLQPGSMVPRHTTTLPQDESSPEPEIKSEPVESEGPMSARPRHSYDSHGTKLLQADIDRGSSLSPEDSISMVGLVGKRNSNQPMQAEQKTDTGYFGKWFSFLKSP